jgi:hypothetical protein
MVVIECCFSFFLGYYLLTMHIKIKQAHYHYSLRYLQDPAGIRKMVIDLIRMTLS